MTKKVKIALSLAMGIFVLFIGINNVRSTISVETSSSSNEVCFTGGNILYVGGSGPNNYTKIQDAIDNATDGDTVFVYSGIFYENIVINTAIDLIGEDMYSTFIDGGNRNMFDAVYIIAHRVTLHGFTIQNSGKIPNGPNQGPDAGIDIRTDDNTITGNRIIKNLVGVHFRTSHNNIVSHNIISENDKSGISFNDWTTDNVISENTIIENKGGGIGGSGFFENHGHTIVENNIENNNPGCGIYFAGASFITISNNTILGNAYQGIFLTSDSSDTHISGNIISYNSRGIEIEYSSQIIISKNVIENNYYGTYIAQSEDIEINLNDIQNSVNIGVVILNGSRIKIDSNNIINNKPNAFFIDSKQVEWTGNYWNRGRFLPKAIFGFKTIIINEDKFFFFPTMAFDWHPALQPYDIGVQ